MLAAGLCVRVCAVRLGMCRAARGAWGGGRGGRDAGGEPVGSPRAGCARSPAGSGASLAG